MVGEIKKQFLASLKIFGAVQLERLAMLRDNWRRLQRELTN